MTQNVPWKDYQEEAALFFRKLGFDAKTDEKVMGARGQHAIDVWVTGHVHNIPFSWAVECKHWKSRVPKEKVLTLLSIVQDVGADRGFMLSENGFQSGASKSSVQTNISLSSLKELHDIVNESLVEDALQRLLWRVFKLKRLLQKAHKKSGDYFSKYMEPLGQLCFLEYSIYDVQSADFPTVYGIKDGNKLTANDMASFISGTADFINEIEAISYALASDQE